MVEIVMFWANRAPGALELSPLTKCEKVGGT